LLLWLAAEVSGPRRRELEATPEEEFRLDPKNNPLAFLALQDRPVFIPKRDRLLDRYGPGAPQKASQRKRTR
jgi:hypothetical protein